MTPETFPKKNGYGIAIAYGVFNQRVESPRTYRTLYGARMAVEDWVERVRGGEELWGPSPIRSFIKGAKKESLAKQMLKSFGVNSEAC